jgi:hypothetical protein
MLVTYTTFTANNVFNYYNIIVICLHLYLAEF